MYGFVMCSKCFEYRGIAQIRWGIVIPLAKSAFMVVCSQFEFSMVPNR